MKTDLFQFFQHRWVFQICWHIECSTWTASSFRFLNTSTRILSPPLDPFIVMLPKAHLALHSRMSGSVWVITPSCDHTILSKSLKSFFYSYSVYSCHFFLISSTSEVLAVSVLYCAHLFILYVSSISLHCSLKKTFYLSLLFSRTLYSIGYIFPFLLCLSLLFSAVGKASLDNQFAFLNFFFLAIVYIISSCYEPLSIVLQALCLPDLISWIY